MESYVVIIILVALAIGLSTLASKIKFPYPVLLLLAGIGVGFIPGFEPISVNPEVVFLIFLPPMLYDAACHTDINSFRINFPTISVLAITLVFLTTMAIAVVVHALIPNMSWASAVVLGAVLSPPDAIAAIGVTKGLNLSKRANTILEGESLINDASALVTLRFAVAAVAGSAFEPVKAGVFFIVAIVGGTAVGWGLWHLFLILIKKKLLTDDALSLVGLMMPFVAYLIAEQFHFSGVIAVVTSGMMIAFHREKKKFSVAFFNQVKANLDTGLFALSGLIFILIGLSFPQVLKEIDAQLILPLIGTSFLIFFIALLVRMFVVFFHKKGIDRKIMHINKLKSMKKYEHFMSVADRKSKLRGEKVLRNYTPLSVKDCIIIGWSGMRGIVSLAAVMSLPLLMSDGTSFPMREELIFLTVCVVIIMLTVQGLGLPILVKLLKMGDKPIEKTVQSNATGNGNV
jgi:CPA1 family monovalent cation:H+ antiporter